MSAPRTRRGSQGARGRTVSVRPVSASLYDACSWIQQEYASSAGGSAKRLQLPRRGGALTLPTALSKVIVLGGGVAGLSAAHELAERDFEVTVMRPDRLRAVDGELLDTAGFDHSSTKPSNTAAAVESTI